jgi:hypothetical protein
MEDSQCVPCESSKKICVLPYQTSPRPTTSYSGRRYFGGTRTNIEDTNKGKKGCDNLLLKKNILLMKLRGYFFNDATWEKKE